MDTPKRFQLTPAAYVILRRENTIFMGKRQNTPWYPDYYGVPAGHIDGHESAKAAAVREAKEEAGIDININDLKFVLAMHRSCDDEFGYREYVDLYFQAEKWQGEPHNAELKKCSEVKWLDPNNLPENIVPDVRKALESISRNEMYSEVGW
ncbi:MAG TPA: NUDIX domain-containing protein [Gammaproteobacteria bacterium]|nr:NUDIX domain-containing protein [Gammaproteobacteria bacterium]